MEAERVDEVRVFGEREKDDGGVGGLQTQGEGEDLFDGNAEEDAHGLEGGEGGGELDEACEKGVGGGLLGAEIEGGVLEEEEGVEGFDALVAHRLVGGVEVDGGCGVGLDGEGEVEGEDGVDHEGCVVEVVHLVEQLAELLGEGRTLQLHV